LYAETQAYVARILSLRRQPGVQGSTHSPIEARALSRPGRRRRLLESVDRAPVVGDPRDLGGARLTDTSTAGSQARSTWRTLGPGYVGNLYSFPAIAFVIVSDLSFTFLS
jgi:hypothetical protein